MNTAIRLFVTGCGAGYLPIAPGTWGSALGMLIAWFAFPHTPALLVATIILSSIAVPAATRAETLFGKTDDGRIVVDEVAGYWVSVLFLPHTIPVFVGAFFLFRLFDVLKPLGINRTQKLPGGWGIVVDDLLAGALANGVLQAAVALFA